MFILVSNESKEWTLKKEPEIFDDPVTHNQKIIIEFDSSNSYDTVLDSVLNHEFDHITIVTNDIQTKYDMFKYLHEAYESFNENDHSITIMLGDTPLDNP